jgi:hypothetical protein
MVLFLGIIFLLTIHAKSMNYAIDGFQGTSLITAAEYYFNKSALNVDEYYASCIRINAKILRCTE